MALRGSNIGAAAQDRRHSSQIRKRLDASRLPPLRKGDRAMDLAQAFNILFLIGRIIVGGFFLMNAFNHFTKTGMMAGYAQSKGTPAPKLAVVGSGVLLLLGGASFLLGFHPTIGTILLVIFLLGVTFRIHAFWKISDPMARMNEMVNFTKNIALIGFLLMTLMIYRPWPMSLGGGSQP
jgi:putative oxidoreductase